MKDREKIREQLSAYLDGELKESDRQLVKKALKGDAELAGELAELKKVRKLLGGLPTVEAGDEFVSRVLGKAERKRLLGTSADTAAAGAAPWVRWVTSAAVLLITVGTGIIVTVVLRSPKYTEVAATGARIEPTGQIARDVGELAEKKVPMEGAAGPPTPLAMEKEAAETKLDVGEFAAKAAPLKEERPAMRSIAKAAEPRPIAEGDRGGTAEDLLTAGVKSAALTGCSDLSDLDETSGGEGFAAARNEFIFTDNLLATQQEVEKILEGNVGVPLTIQTPTITPGPGRIVQLRGLAGGYVQNVATPNQMQYAAYLTPVQMANVTKELDNIRRQQVVSQVIDVPPRPIAAEPPRKLVRRRSASSAPHDRLAAAKDAADHRRTAQLEISPQSKPGFVAPQVDRSPVASAGESCIVQKVEPLLITLTYRPPAIPGTPPSSAEESTPRTTAPPKD
jgi:hypothetical protein